MKRIYHSRAVPDAPKPPVSPSSEGFPTNGSAGGGRLATVIGDYWYYMMTEELANVVESVGFTTNTEDLGQVNAAIDEKIRRSADVMTETIKRLEDSFAKLQRKATPTGQIAPFAMASDVENWLPCDGRAVSRATYPDLFRAIGERWGRGNGSTTFNLPDFRGRFLEGSASVGSVGRRHEAGIPNITGEFVQATYYGSHTAGAFFPTDREGGPCAHKGDWRRIAGFDASRCSPVYGKSNTVQPASAEVFWMIHI